jgi:hypothetical protein
MLLRFVRYGANNVCEICRKVLWGMLYFDQWLVTPISGGTCNAIFQGRAN